MTDKTEIALVNKNKLISIDDELELKDIKNIMFEDIDKKYCYGYYGDFKVIMIKKNGYINATKLCKMEDKSFGEWKKNSSSKEYVKVMAKHLKKKEEDLILTITGGSNTLVRGSYVHYDLILIIAIWTSPVFGIKCSEIVRSYFSKNVLRAKDKESKKLKGIIVEQKDQIEVLQSDMKKLLKKNDYLIEKNDYLIEKNDVLLSTTKKLHKKIDDLHDLNEQMDEKADVMQDKLEKACDKIVVPTGAKGDVNRLVIVRNGPKKKTEKKKKNKKSDDESSESELKEKIMKIHDERLKESQQDDDE